MCPWASSREVVENSSKTSITTGGCRAGLGAAPAWDEEPSEHEATSAAAITAAAAAAVWRRGRGTERTLVRGTRGGEQLQHPSGVQRLALVRTAGQRHVVARARVYRKVGLDG